MRRHCVIFATVLSFLFLAMPTQAHEAGKWVFRFGLGTVQPDDRNLVIDETTSVQVENGTSVTLNLTYFFTPNLAFDILGAFPFKHDIKLVEDGVELEIAETKHLPPTFSLQYHFLPEGSFQPYVGVGANWTTFFNTDVNDEFGGEDDDLNLDDSFGLAAQLGADFLVGDDWLVNVDVRYIEIETDAELIDSELGGIEIGSVAIDPWIYSINFGYRF